MFNKSEMNDDEFSRFLIGKYEIELLCITYGEKGAVLYQNDEQYVLVPDKISVVSTVGAGDSFSAGLVHGLISTGSVTTAGELALKVAGCVVSNRGALLNYRDIKVDGSDVTLMEAVRTLKADINRLSS